jgi:hypothetical protein
VIALTGSQGKTSVKEMIGSILKAKAQTLITAENLNNTIGVPLTLLRLEDTHQFAVIEMGANGAGEIAFSVAAARPDIVLITKASAAHIEGFGSLQGIVEAKGEIIDGLSGSMPMTLIVRNGLNGQARVKLGCLAMATRCPRQTIGVRLRACLRGEALPSRSTPRREKSTPKYSCSAAITRRMRFLRRPVPWRPAPA